jgi:site-specific DNA-methyltransferase (adenine-specific)
MKQLPDGCVDMVLCDLPYGTTSNKWDYIIPMDELWNEYKRICKPTAAIVLTASQPFTSKLVMSNPDMFKHEWIWQKNRGSNFANTVREPFKEHESVLVFSRGKWTYNAQMQERAESGKARANYKVNHTTKTQNYNSFGEMTDQTLGEMRKPSSVQKFICEVGLHPTQKPVDLFRYLIRTYSNKGDLILDNCAGSGTTAIAAIKEERDFLCIEKEMQYYDVIRTRIKDSCPLWVLVHNFDNSNPDDIK